jgi:hypothetical protein
MSEFPRGEWSPVLVGDQWPSDLAMATIDQGETNRGNTETGFNHFGDLLHDAQTGPLAEQQGHTADDIRDAFRRGEQQARQVAHKNGVKRKAYSTAHDSMQSLRQVLTGLADEGNKAIEDIKNSKEPTELKVGQIVGVIHQYRALANIAAAKYGGNVLDAIQSILDEEGTGQSAREFAQANGRDVSQMFRQPDDQKDLEKQVRGFVEKSDSSTATTPNFNNTPGPAPALPQAQPGQVPGSSTPSTPNFNNTPGPAPALPQAQPGEVPGSSTHITPNFNNTPVAVSPPVPPSSSKGVPSAPSVSMPSPGAGLGPLPATGSPSLPSAAASLPGAPSAPTTGPAQGMTSANLMQDFNAGMQAGAPTSAAANAVPTAPTSPTESQLPPTAPTTPMAGPETPAPAFATPPAEHLPAPPAPSADAPTPMVATPAASAGAAAPPPAGPETADGADLRPPVAAATTPAAPPSPPPPPASAAAGSAPVHPAAGQASVSQPAVVRHPAQSPTSPPPSGIGTQAISATAVGAVAGAASADATARARLQRIVETMARQQPRLAWAAGDRDDDTTVLITDLASGWIPPGLDLPAAVTLLEPARRRGDLESLLGEVRVATGYTPIHYLPDEDHEPIPTSPRPRRAPEIEELGWELNQATSWRDGLPQLAHTLAKAAFRGTGVLDKEVELLHEYLSAVETRVLDSYPDHVDPDEVGNWQLLAAIDALVAGDKTAANYHLAWFQACAATAAHG